MHNSNGQALTGFTKLLHILQRTHALLEHGLQRAGICIYKSKYKFELMEIITDVIYVLFNFGCLKPNAKIHLIDTMEQGPYDPVITPLSEIRISFSSLDKRGREG